MGWLAVGVYLAFLVFLLGPLVIESTVLGWREWKEVFDGLRNVRSESSDGDAV